MILGAARTGKTSITKTIAEKYNYQIISIDSCISAIANTFPELNITHSNNNKKFETIPGFIKNFYIKFKKDYNIPVIIEGWHVFPNEIIAEFKNEDVELICIGNHSQEISEKKEWLRKFATKEDYCKTMTDEQLNKLARDHINYSNEIKKQADKHCIKYFDVSRDWEKIHKNIIEYIEQILINSTSV